MDFTGKQVMQTLQEACFFLADAQKAAAGLESPELKRAATLARETLGYLNDTAVWNTPDIIGKESQYDEKDERNKKRSSYYHGKTIYPDEPLSEYQNNFGMLHPGVNVTFYSNQLHQEPFKTIAEALNALERSAPEGLKNRINGLAEIFRKTQETNNEVVGYKADDLYMGERLYLTTEAIKLLKEISENLEIIPIPVVRERNQAVTFASESKEPAELSPQAFAEALSPSVLQLSDVVNQLRSGQAIDAKMTGELKRAMTSLQKTVGKHLPEALPDDPAKKR